MILFLVFIILHKWEQRRVICATRFATQYFKHKAHQKYRCQNQRYKNSEI